MVKIDLTKQVNWNNLLLAALTLAPILVGYYFFRDPLLINVGLVTTSLFIPIARIKSGASLAILQFFLIWFCFSLLYFSLSKPYLFILLCAFMAFATIFVTRYGSALRTVANFVFIPAVYLAYQFRENLASDHLGATYIKFISLMPIALGSVLILLFCFSFFSYKKSPNTLSDIPYKIWARHILYNKQNFGEIKRSWLKEAIAIFVGVMIAAAYVVFIHVEHGEWVIWSTAAVITSDLLSSKAKAQDRLIGLFCGVPLGFLLAHFLPKTDLNYSLAALLIMLTLIAFNNYRLAFGSRCFFIAIASYIATSAPHVALERVGNVILGAVIGMTVLYICHRIMKHVDAKKYNT